jgi:biotin transport system permease protein
MLTQTWPVETRFHRVPAGVKVALLAVLGGCLAWIGTIWVLGLTLALVWLAHLAGGWALFARAPRLLWPVWPFVLVIGGWHVWRGTPDTGAVIVLRMAIMLMAANLVLLTTRLDALIGLFRSACRPLALAGIPPDRVAVALAMTVRFVPVMLLRAGLFRDAWRARSARSPRHRLIGPLALSALDEAERVAEALRARGGSA